MTGQGRLTEDETKKMMSKLSQEWSLGDREILRQFKFKGYAKAVYTANIIAALCDRYGHHADVKFGWGYCNVRLTTHDSNGLTKNDFELANAIDKATEL